ncbi:hypothetical protein HYALB_00011786 [Hymenoscyphus albidus]|uniref:Heterokaryon incompatibility domain-containing protein n=1 Tax=Hymenoscyphus albidus TaxID=595503 RepID=A0A9N9LI53_9HELO|nr:hypothetical protein HYALB_00011786 [Hymenoscyphus albidus]
MASLTKRELDFQSRTFEYPGTELGANEAQIRLLEVLPGQGEDPVRCILTSVNFDATHEADALSYTWGLPPAANIIFVNDEPFRIRNNLFNALLHLRQPSSGVMLWVDAICINQSDIDERNHQVQRMADVFSRARRVLAWLGPETESNREAFSFLSQTYLRSPYNRKELMDDPRWVAFKDLCEIEYWKRVWIVQEICLASRAVICCGRQQIPWKYLSELRKSRKHIWPQYLSSGERQFMRSLPARLDQQKEARSNGGCVLWTLLETFKDSLCQEVHDKIYGFMGLSTDCGGRGLTIDYTKSVEQIYQDVICFYYDKFRQESSSHCAAQLMKLSEFLQALLGNHPADGHGIQNLALDEQAGPAPSSFVSISACNVWTIFKFPYSDSDDAKLYGVSDLIDFLDGKIPYSHLGYWRDLVESDLKGIGEIRDSRVYATIKGVKNPFNIVRKVKRPSVFLATQFDHGTVKHGQPYVLGIAPSDSQTGDIVLSFVDTQISLIMTRSQPENSTTADPQINVEDNKYILIGRGCIFMSHSKSKLPFRSQLTAEKYVEVVRTEYALTEADTRSDPFPAVLYINLSTLQLVSTSNTDQLLSGFNEHTFDLFPSESPETASTTDIYAHKLRKVADDLELLKMQEDPELKRYALGHGYTATTNPGAIGYVISSLQIFYILKAFRTAVLSTEETATYDSMGVIATFGWGEEEINEPQDFMEFWRKLIYRIEETTIGSESTSFQTGSMATYYLELGSARHEHFYDMNFRMGFGLNRLEDSLEDCFDMEDTPDKRLTLTKLPEVLILHGNFWYYDVVSDSLEKLHGVVVLEEVKPAPRYLLYLRPNTEEQWILFFKETVSYAQRSEVFEDNFRLDNEKTKNAPLRTPYVFVYILKWKLDKYLV